MNHLPIRHQLPLSLPTSSLSDINFLSPSRPPSYPTSTSSLPPATKLPPDCLPIRHQLPLSLPPLNSRPPPKLSETLYPAREPVDETQRRRDLLYNVCHGERGLNEQREDMNYELLDLVPLQLLMDRQEIREFCSDSDALMLVRRCRWLQLGVVAGTEALRSGLRGRGLDWVIETR